MKPYRIIIADDHRLMRQGIKSIIESAEDLAVVGEAGDGLELLGLLKKVIPDMVMLDISMPNLRGFEAASEIQASHPGVKILVLSMHRETEYVYHAFSAGASGYLLKEDTDTELFSAIQTIREGNLYISPLLQKEITTDMLKNPLKPFAEPLSTREREVLQLLAEGKSSKEIAQALFISVRTVDHHRASIINKLGLKTIADLVKYAIRKGLTTTVTP